MFEIRGVPAGTPDGIYPSRIGAPEVNSDGSVTIPVNWAPDRSLSCSIFPIHVGIDF
jgi:hypothetical protein